jgi:hypothetical protein
VNEYGSAPPITVALIHPVESPKQNTGCTLEEIKAAELGCVIEYELMILHPLKSVMVKL